MGLPVIHLDRCFPRPGWQDPEKELWWNAAARLAAAPRWIIDDDHGAAHEERLAAADTLIHLDLPTWLCLARAIRQTVRHHGKVRVDELPEGCPERFDAAFFWHVMTDRARHRPRHLADISCFEGKVVRVKCRRANAALIAASF
jgi:adenylate kinase family enzyme